MCQLKSEIESRIETIEFLLQDNESNPTPAVNAANLRIRIRELKSLLQTIERYPNGFNSQDSVKRVDVK